VEELHSRFGTRLHSGPLAGTEYAFLNVTRPPFDDPRIRLALNLAVDRARVVDLLGGTDAAGATCQILPLGCPATNRSARSPPRRSPAVPGGPRT